jgi:hypothetical protein
MLGRSDRRANEGADLPIISRFLGIVAYMHWREHGPPHFHAKYQGREVAVEIETGEVTGQMTPKALSLIEEWRQLHKDELLDDWRLAEQRRTLRQIQPLE